MHPGSISFNMIINKCIPICLFILFIMMMEFTVSKADSKNDIVSESHPSLQKLGCGGSQSPTNGVCGSVDIRSSMDNFKLLENCTVIEGSLRISLFELKALDFRHLSFPDLREITDYLLMYRVYGLETLSKLFPNLAIIRGRELFNSYAIVMYEMRDLQDLGLVNLRTISRGGVRLTKNFKLCYIETINWTQIGVSDPEARRFINNKEQCPNSCKDECQSKRCWTYSDCQKGLNCQCKENTYCMENGSCCHDYCLGGCKVPMNPDECFSCKEVQFNNTCRPQCPPGTYKFLNRRCLTDKECLALTNDPDGNTPKLLDGEKGEPSLCLYTCPQNYSVGDSKDNKNLSQCVKCRQLCPKECHGLEINNIQDAHKLKECSKISGPLKIQIMSGSNVAQELEKSLGNIREVTETIHIKRSYALVTLHFFKNLQIIGSKVPSSETQEGQSFSLFLMDNTNLQELFPEEQMKKMKILNGGIYVHDNGQLCPHTIKEFLSHLNLSEAQSSISSISNGHQRPCEKHDLNVTVEKIAHNAAILAWNKYKADERQLLTYILNYKEIKDESNDINIFQGRDLCSHDLWMTREYAPKEGPEADQIGMLYDLKPFTTYAVYIQAYTVSTATHAAMTNILTFTTYPFHPSEPTDLVAISEDPHELRVSWKPPKYPNGNITHYKIVYHKLELNEKSYEQRNYCRDPLVHQKKKEKVKIEEEGKKINNSANSNCCKCPKSKEEMDTESRKREIEMYFEDYLHKHIYCKRYDKLPDEVDLNFDGMNLPQLVEMNYNSSETSDRIEVFPNYVIENTSDLANLTEIVKEVVVYGTTEVTLPNLEHFSEYSIEVLACQDYNEKVLSKLCSIRAITFERTKDSYAADMINETTVDTEIETNFTGNVFIKWESPTSPNGLILKYLLWYKKANQENLVPQTICITRQEYLKNLGYKLTRLEPGNWTFKISAISLAENSSFTLERFFIVPRPPDPESSNTLLIVAIVLAFFGVLTVSLIVACVYYKQKIRSDDMTVISRNMNYVPSEILYISDEWEVDRDKIKLIKELGQGSFGMVYEGVAKGIRDDPNEEIPVAVKTVNDRASFSDRREFLKEATTMKEFHCHHVVKLLGVVSTGQPALVIMELMALGDLKNYLRGHRPDEDHPGVMPPHLLDILQMAGEIADGMAYLADKKFVHRDLAARNCMVSEERTVKIGDFGMTRDIYETDYYRKGGKGMLPVRWMAPESLKDGVFTSLSDVWSYGVVMWEMVTLAAQPYQGLSNEEVVKFISDGYIMELPENCPNEMAYLMQHCWAKKPNQRPTFKAIIEYLLPKLKPSFEKVSYFFTSGGGHTDGAGEGTLAEPEGSDDSSSINSLSCEGAAAPRQSLTPCGGGQFKSSTHFNGGSHTLYDEGVDRETILNGVDDGDEDEAAGRYSLSEFGEDLDDSSRPFMSDDFIPPVMTRQPLLSHQSNGNDSNVRNSGLIELKPLINKDKRPGLSSPRLNARSNPFSSEYIGHYPPTLTTELETLNGNQSSHNNNSFELMTPDPLKSGPASESSNGVSSSSWRPKPILKLPTLNQARVGDSVGCLCLTLGTRINIVKPIETVRPETNTIRYLKPPHPMLIWSTLKMVLVL
uniref:Putative molluscan insulin-related peptide(s) receptor n=1 Tax=Lymnaea stagnalis TaxID=6523 RepID=MIPR_LYMST|nr:RecName: Full=Putative molluscan insulin-related peptide(s) receptor; Contains: RecName: Full=Putative molluscan insulin-related peptide(s) receptor alpha chain; Contains: RecName: Full=Putative molluscan insulin-related peptide(s) receptor beta chain; Flags: Precursor [Lymnaea stagnalis]CAA59353.1 putative receptor for molluscan insulin-related peptide(s) [Lymnaea stagnalis]